MKNPKLAAFLSLVFPGLGQFYLRHYVDGVVFAAGAGFLWYALFVRASYLMKFDNFQSFLVWGALAFIYAFSIINAYLKTKKN